MLFMLAAILLINLLTIVFTVLLYAGVPITLFILALKSKKETTLFYFLLLLSLVFAYFLFPELIRQLTNYKFIK